MATDQRNVNFTVADDTAFRAAAFAISDALQDCGLTKTADTGQIDLATVTKPATAPLSAGYEIYRFNDTLQATTPVFIKIEYGVSASATVFATWITVSSATNGAGTMTGQTYLARVESSLATGAAASQLYTSVGPGRIGIYSAGASASTSYSLFIERALDSGGRATADGVISLYKTATSGVTRNLGYGPTVGTAATIVSTSYFPFVSGLGVTSTASDVAMMPISVPFAGKWRYTSLLLYASADIAALSTFTISHLGSSRPYIALGANAGTVQTGTNLAMHYA